MRNIQIKISKLLKTYKYRFKGSYLIKNYSYSKLLRMGIDIPPSVIIGKNLQLPHPYAIVIHPNTVIGDDVKIYQNVTIGRGDIYNSDPAVDFQGFQLNDGAIICGGAKIISSHGCLIVGNNSIVGANAVVLESIPDESIAIGIPAIIFPRKG